MPGAMKMGQQLILSTRFGINPIRHQVLQMILDELELQDAKWGKDRIQDVRDIYCILGEEVGEVAIAINEKQGQQQIIDEFIDVAASASYGVESELRKRRNEFSARSEQPISEFQGDYRFLSNFYEPCSVLFEGLVYPSVEHAYQAAKTTSPAFRQLVKESSSAAAAKRNGRALELRPDWNEVKLKVMLTCLKSKFDDPVLKQKLCQTAPRRLMEGNNWGDTYWGVVLATGVGANHLGEMLMRLRDFYLGQGPDPETFYV